ncbi:unnamed protein product [Discula destructiva]
MDCSTTTPRIDIYTIDPQSTSCGLASPDPEARGRQRRRDPLNLFAIPRHNPSRESSTLRGRCRHRSTSRMNLVTLTSTTAASQHGRSHRGDRSPERRLLAAGVIVVRAEGPRRCRRRRGQSPSRSRSPGRGSGSGSGKVAEVLVVSPVVGKRRRQRSQSRGRRHGLEGAFASVVLAGRPTLGFDGWVAEDGGVSDKD